MLKEIDIKHYTVELAKRKGFQHSEMIPLTRETIADWLRNEHKIKVKVNEISDYKIFTCSISLDKNDQRVTTLLKNSDHNVLHWKEYHSAFEFGINEALIKIQQN